MTDTITLTVPYDRPYQGVVRLVESEAFREAEIQHLDLPAFGHADVGRFEIPVHDAPGIGGVQRVRHLNRHLHDLPHLQRRIP